MHALRVLHAAEVLANSVDHEKENLKQFQQVVALQGGGLHAPRCHGGPLSGGSCRSHEENEEGPCCEPFGAAAEGEAATPSRSVSLELEGTERLREVDAGARFCTTLKIKIL